jgi:hypothetical protein
MGRPMTDHYVQLVKSFIDRFSSGDIEAASQHLDDRAIIDEAGDLPYSGRYVGPRGLQQLVRKIPRSLRTRIQSVEVASAGSFVVSKLGLRFVSRSTGHEVAVEAVEIYMIEAGLITHVDVYYKSAAAIRALVDESS